MASTDPLGLDDHDELQPASQPVQLGTVHVGTLEAGLVDAAMPGMSWREVIDRDNETRRLYSYRPPDVAAAKALLAAHAPGRYGGQANQQLGVVVTVVTFDERGNRHVRDPIRNGGGTVIDNSTQRVVSTGTTTHMQPTPFGIGAEVQDTAPSEKS